MTLDELYFQGTQILKQAGVESYSFDVTEILKKVLSMNRHDIIIKKYQLVSPEQKKEFLSLIDERKQGRPLQYIIGRWHFMDLEFEVGEGVLIPRDDTEVLVNECIKVLSKTKKPRILDLCSGSGIVAIAISKFLSQSDVCAVEVSEDAIKYLSRNIKLNNSKNVSILRDNVLDPQSFYVPKSFDLIASNPPYIKSHDVELLQKEVRREPRLALDGGKDGLNFYRAFANYFINVLKPGGHICVEVGFDQAYSVKKIFDRSTDVDKTYIVNDINNIKRVVVAKTCTS